MSCQLFAQSWYAVQNQELPNSLPPCMCVTHTPFFPKNAGVSDAVRQSSGLKMIHRLRKSNGLFAGYTPASKRVSATAIPKSTNLDMQMSKAKTQAASAWVAFIFTNYFATATAFLQKLFRLSLFLVPQNNWQPLATISQIVSLLTLLTFISQRLQPHQI